MVKCCCKDAQRILLRAKSLQAVNELFCIKGHLGSDYLAAYVTIDYFRVFLTTFIRDFREVQKIFEF